MFRVWVHLKLILRGNQLVQQHRQCQDIVSSQHKTMQWTFQLTAMSNFRLQQLILQQLILQQLQGQQVVKVIKQTMPPGIQVLIIPVHRLQLVLVAVTSRGTGECLLVSHHHHTLDHHWIQHLLHLVTLFHPLAITSRLRETRLRIQCSSLIPTEQLIIVLWSLYFQDRYNMRTIIQIPATDHLKLNYHLLWALLATSTMLPFQKIPSLSSFL